MRVKRKIGVFEIVLLVIEVFAIGFIMREALFGVPGALAQEIPPSPEGSNTGGSQQPGDNQDFNDAVIATGIDSEEVLNNEIEQTLNSGIVSPQFLQFLQLVNSLLPEIPNFGGGQLQGFLSQIDGVKVCPKDKDNAICQNYAGKDCAANCPGGCLAQDVSKNPLPDDSVCALGTCYDPKEGTCAGGAQDGGSPRAACENLGGQWFKKGDSKADALCRKGCCQLGDQAIFTTQGGCNKTISDLGLKLGDEGINFDSSLNEELKCLASVAPLLEGACTTPSAENPGKNECRFVDDKECSELGGNFNLNYLCSNIDLNTTCAKQNSTSCLEGKDEVYWLDSCGNRENIYQSDKEKGWNNGMVLPKEQSCMLGTSTNPVENYKICGNCNRLLSSYCGNKTKEQEIPGENVVCRDMGCKVPDLSVPVIGATLTTKRRENGESWCGYDSSIGLPGPDISGIDSLISFLPGPISGLLGGTHGTDTPGSRHFRMVCQNGEVIVSPCADFRNQVCVEQQTPKGVDPSLIDINLLATNPQQFFENIGSAAQNFNLFAGTFSQASCRTNRWQECLAYNPNQMQGRLIGMASEKAGLVLKLYLMSNCGRDPDCFVKDVKVDDKFEFSYCVPRYKPGFDLKDNAKAAEQICSMGSQTCTAFFVKEAKAGGFAGAEWKCKANCKCVDYKDGDDPKNAKPSKEFTKQMNDFCISLGDCGYHVGYTGNLPGGTGFSTSATACDVEDKKCGQKVQDQIRGSIPLLGGDISSAIPVVGGLLSGADPHLFDAFPMPGEYIQASATNPNAGQQDPLRNLLNGGGLGGIGERLNRFLSGGGGGPSAPSTGTSTTGGYVFAGISGAAGGIAMASSFAVLTTQTVSTTIPGTGTVTFSDILLPSAGLQAFAAAAWGAAAGVAIATVLIDVLGIGAGLDPVTAYTMIGVAGVGGALVGLSFVGVNTGPIGWTLLVAAVMWMTILKIIGVGEQKRVAVSFRCKPWERPIMGDCESCGKDGLSPSLPQGQKWPCSKYTCETLGQNCQFVQDSERPGEGGLCISSSLNDVSAPKLEKWREEVLSMGFKYEDKTTGALATAKVRKTSSGEGCIDQFERVAFGFNLDEYGRCRISAVPPSSLPAAQEQTNNQGGSTTPSGNAILPGANAQTSGTGSLPQGQQPSQQQIQQQVQQMKPESPTYLAMAPIPGESGLQKEHTVSFNSRNLDDWGYTQELTNDKNDITLYIACQDYLKNDNALNPFKVNLCVMKRDLTPVQYLDLNGLEQYLGFDRTTTDFSITINEAAQCRWDTQDTAYDTMRNSFTGDCTEDASGNYVCNADNVPVNPWENRICVKCRDHPNLPTENRNTNGDCFWVTIRKSPSQLRIISVTPGNGETLLRRINPSEIELDAETSGGIENGKASCYYNIDNSGSDLMSGSDSVHTQTLTQVRGGTHNLTISCADTAGNAAQQNSTFTLNIDDAAPQVTSSGFFGDPPNVLRIETDEKATCAFSAREDRNAGPCNFQVKDAGNNEISLMISDSNGRIHLTDFANGAKYYVKCKDELGNEPLACSTDQTLTLDTSY